MSSYNRGQRTIPAGEFKNRCLALMDEVNETGEEIVITKHGRPVSRLVPARRRMPLVGMFRDRLRVAGDIMSPAAPAEEWESISNPDRVLDPGIQSGQ
ncbi:MAG: type II toxin-antitoxin system prevent-host-death family antitoxin [bacterium]|nr:type II toxin-antitoxin system prevent-host-death family antitoxin [bacterium]MDE0287781.1 type II toxin-antitoxin system prevent-host-death family antitoxin [bacterium]MDE0439062.1 type II toxin-antitoxin system prevent-host-death family antitoxin [bacterium]